MQEIRLPFYARLALVLLIIVLITYLLVLGKGIFVPLFFSLLIAFLIYPVARKIENRTGMSKEWASLIALSTFVLIIALLLYFITFQILEFSQDIPLMQRKITEWIDHTQTWIVQKYQIDSTQQLDYLHQVSNDMLNYAANSLGAVFIGVAEFIFWMVLVFIYTYFIMCHRRLLLHFVMKLFPQKHRMKVRNAVMETRAITNSYLQGLFIEFIVVAIANTAMFYLIGVEYALLLGIITALLNIIPYLGIIIGVVLTAMVTLTRGTPFLAIEAAALLFLLHILDANILLPRVIGIKMKINSLITIVSVLVGSVIWGIAGMFLAIPMCAMLKIVFDHVESLEPWGMLMGVEDKDA